MFDRLLPSTSSKTSPKRKVQPSALTYTLHSVKSLRPRAGSATLATSGAVAHFTGSALVMNVDGRTFTNLVEMDGSCGLGLRVMFVLLVLLMLLLVILPCSRAVHAWHLQVWAGQKRI